jgi:hypothetical protein
MKKRALIVGINYAGSGNDLKGCINDAHNMEALLKSKGFTEIKMLLEQQATTAGMIAGMEWLVKDTEPGDVIVFHYSGHGSQLPSKTEPDGYEEILCPYDLDWMTKVITDDTLRNIFNRPVRGVNTTVILDCCHSGTALDQSESLQVETTKSIEVVVIEPKEGDRYLPPPPNVQEMLENRELVDWHTQRDINAGAMLIAGCRADQTSADAFIDGQFQGAATAALISNVKTKPGITYLGLITAMNNYMMEKKFTQRPQLDGFAGLREKQFIEPWGSPADTLPIVDTGPEPLPPSPPVTGLEKKDYSMYIIAAAVIAMVLFLLFK